MHLWLTSLLFMTILRVNWACETMIVQIPKNNTCYSHAAFFNPEYYKEYPNNTCVLHRVCSNNIAALKNNETIVDISLKTSVQIEKKKGKLSLITVKTITTVNTRKFDWKCPSFEKVSTGQKVLLLRTHASSRVSPYFHFHQGNTSQLHLTVKDADDIPTVNFKSPLLSEDRHALLKYMYVELLDETGRLQTSVGFRINPNESIRNGKWFAKERLISSFPWSFKSMNATTYNSFSIDGVKTSSATRHFYINVNGDDCPDDQGYMAIVERGECPYEIGQKYVPTYIWTIAGDSYGTYRLRTYESTEFRIYGVFEASSSTIYVRKSKNC